MQCGATCFLVEVEVSGIKKTKKVIARTPVTARKTIRREFGNSANIISVAKKNK